MAETTEEFALINSTSSRDFKDAIKIYIESFPPNERQTVENICYKLNNKQYFMIIYKKNNATIAFSLIYIFKDEKFALFDYMAVEKNHRNKGVGSKLFNHTCEFAFDKLKDDNSLIILEVEDPKHGNNPEENILRKRRIELYHRLGAKIIEKIKYFLPPLSEKKPTIMIIMALSKNNLKKINKEYLVEILTTIYSNIYNRGTDDKYLNQMINTIKNMNDSKHINLEETNYGTYK